MKLTNLAKGLVAASALTVASFSANAGVVASSFLEVTNFSLNGVTTADLTFLAPGTREGQTASQINIGTNLTDGDSDAGSALADVDALMACVGNCAPLGLVENSGSIHWADGLANDYNYSYSDQNVFGNALNGTSSGFTLAEASLSKVPAGNASSSGDIFNEFEALFSSQVTKTVDFTLDYVLSMASVITPDIAFDDYITATTTATANFTVTLTNLFSGAIQQWTIVDETISGRDGAFFNTLFPGANDEFINTASNFNSGSFNLVSGQAYSLNITQSTAANVSLVPEPNSIALFGLALVGLAGAIRRRQA